MFRLWGKIIKNNNIESDHVFELSAPELSSDEKLEQGIEGLCYHFDIQVPMWFASNDSEFKLIGKTRFSAQHFIEEIRFDTFEIEIVEDK